MQFRVCRENEVNDSAVKQVDSNIEISDPLPPTLYSGELDLAALGEFVFLMPLDKTAAAKMEKENKRKGDSDQFLSEENRNGNLPRGASWERRGEKEIPSPPAGYMTVTVKCTVDSGATYTVFQKSASDQPPYILHNDTDTIMYYGQVQSRNRDGERERERERERE